MAGFADDSANERTGGYDCSVKSGGDEVERGEEKGEVGDVGGGKRFASSGEGEVEGWEGVGRDDESKKCRREEKQHCKRHYIANKM